MISARFDDLRTGHPASFRLDGLIETFGARTPAEVGPALDRAEDAVAAGRWVAGWVGYEAAPAFDDAFVVRPTDDTPFADLPLVWFAVFTHRLPVDEPEGQQAGETAGQPVSRPADGPSGEPVGESLVGWTPTIDAPRYRADIAAVHARIRAGDTYQVNHTFRLSAPFDGDAERLYGRLVRAQRAGYGACLAAGRWTVASASPEVFFEWTGDEIRCRPMKGTARRGIDAATDARRRDALLASAKDRAENVMIVDMIRNDLGRIAIPGTVGVPALFTAEKYDAWQLTSTVTARVRPRTRLRDVFGALFPCASITGAPRASTMAIIAELETTPRGVYCGAIGFGGPGPDGPRWAFNVAIRSVLIDAQERTAWYGTGGGVTMDSAASGEYAEALLKTEVLSRAAPDFALLETLRWTPDGSPLLERHLARLAASAEYFDIPLDPDAVRAALADAVAGRTSPARVRLVVDRAGAPTVEVADAPPPRTAPVRAVLDTAPGDSGDVFARHKTTRRVRYEQAAARHPGAEDVVLVNERGELTETTLATLAVRLDGTWWTPPLASGCLPGVARAATLDAGDLRERVLVPADLARAEAIARLNALRGWEPMTGAVADRAVP